MMIKMRCKSSFRKEVKLLKMKRIFSGAFFVRNVRLRKIVKFLEKNVVFKTVLLVSE